MYFSNGESDEQRVRILIICIAIIMKNKEGRNSAESALQGAFHLTS